MKICKKSVITITVSFLLPLFFPFLVVNGYGVTPVHSLLFSLKMVTLNDVRRAEYVDRQVI